MRIFFKAICFAVVPLIILCVLPVKTFADTSDMQTRIESLKTSANRPLNDTAETSEIVQQYRDKLELLSLETFNINSRSITMCDYRLASAEDAAALAKKISAKQENFTNFISSLDEQIAQGRISQRYAILGLPEKLQKLKAPARLQLARVKFRLAHCLYASQNKANRQQAKSLAHQAAQIAKELKNSQSRSIKQKAHQIEARSKAIYDFTKAHELFRNIASDSSFDNRSRLLICFELSWLLAENNDHDAAKQWRSQFGLIFGEITKDKNELSLSIYNTILYEHIQMKQAEFMQLTDGASISQYEKNAGEALENLFKQYRDSHLSLAKLLENSFSGPDRGSRRHPAIFYSRGLLAANAGNIQQAKFWLERCGENYKSEYFYRNAQLKLAKIFESAASASKDIEQNWLLRQQAAKYYEFYARHWPRDGQAYNAARYAIDFAKDTNFGGEKHISLLKFAIENIMFCNLSHRPMLTLELADALSYSTNKNLPLAAKYLAQIVDSDAREGLRLCCLAQLYKTLAIIAAQNDETDKIKPLLQKLTQLSQQSPIWEIRLHLAELYLVVLNNPEKALELAPHPQLDYESGNLDVSMFICRRADFLSWTIKLRAFIKLGRHIEAAKLLKSHRNAFDFINPTPYDIFSQLTNILTEQILSDLASDNNNSVKNSEALLELIGSEPQLNKLTRLNGKHSDYYARLLAQLAIGLCETGKTEPAREKLALAEQIVPELREIQLVSARLDILDGNWREAVKKYHKILPAEGLHSEKYNTKSVWITEALLARCIYDNTADNPTERRRLALRLRQLELRDKKFGHLRPIFQAMME